MIDEELRTKLSRLDSLARQIKAKASKVLSPETKSKEKELMERMEFRLDELVLESKKKEVDVKVSIYEELLSIL